MENSPRYANRPPRETAPASMPLIRTPISGKFVGLITCADALCVPTHWYGGRTTPCLAPECKPCSEGRGTRWHGYLSVWNPNDKSHVLLELPEAAAHRVCELSDVAGNLRGHKIVTFRVTAKQNARVICNFFAPDPGKYQLPQEPNIRNILEHIWRLDRPAEAPKSSAETPPLKLKQA